MSPTERPGKASRRPRAKRGGRSALARAKQAWQRAADDIEAQVLAGRFRESGRLPAEAVLARELDLTRHTLRRAIAALVRKGILRNVPHIGTFVAPKKIPFTIGAKTSFFDALSAAGFSPGRRRVSCRECHPPAEVARGLEIAARSKVIEIVHVVTGNELPLACMTLWFPVDRFARIPDLLSAAGTLRRAMAQLGVGDYRRKAVRVTSRCADRVERDLLDLPATAILIGFDGVSVDERGEATHGFQYCFDADRVELMFEP
jgi:GntR family phosphonate transport system transcriptional regulator